MSANQSLKYTKKRNRSTTKMIQHILSSTPELSDYIVYKKPYNTLDPHATKIMDIIEIKAVYTKLTEIPTINALFESHKLGLFAKKPDERTYIYAVAPYTLNKPSGFDLSKQYEERELEKLGVKYVITVPKIQDAGNANMLTCTSSRTLSSGSFGSVELCTTLPDKPSSYPKHQRENRKSSNTLIGNNRYIVKYMKKEHDFAAAQHEIDMMRKLQGHPNFVHVYPHITLTNPSSPLYIVQEYCNLGDLLIFTDDIDTHMSLNTLQLNTVLLSQYSKMIKNLFSDIYSAIKYIHSKELIHGDIKPENIFVSSVDANSADKTPLDRVVFKLGDLGGIHNASQYTKVHTQLYSPGEKHLLHTYFLDYYGLALTLYAVITLNLPPKDKFYTDGSYITLYDIYSKLLAPDEYFKTHLTIECQDLIQSLFFLLGNIERTLLDNPDDDERLDMAEYVAFFSHFAPLNNYKYTMAKLHNDNIRQHNATKRASLKRRGVDIATNGTNNNSYV